MAEKTGCSMEKATKRGAEDEIELPAKRVHQDHPAGAIEEPKNQGNVLAHGGVVAESSTSITDSAKSGVQKTTGDAVKHNAKTIKIPVVSDDIAYLEHIRHKVIGTIGLLSKRSGPGSVPPSELLDRLDQFFNWLETRPWGPEYLPLSNRKTLETMLRFVWEPTEKRTQAYFSGEQKTRAKALTTNWGDKEASLFVDDDENDSQMPADATEDAEMITKTKPTKKPTKDSGLKIVDFRLPPLDHHIFGLTKPMCGIAYILGKTKVYHYNPQMAGLKKSSHAFGHNGIEPGAWWPMQAAAVFNGAHGSWQGGISGHAGEGAYSIVISGAYKGCDADQGNTLHYSGSGADVHTGQTPQNKDGTKLLHLSLKKGNPVRVLRSASGKGGAFRPSHGIRYDGLYKVTQVRILTKQKGGAYYQFELERLPGQKDLVELLGTPDNAQQAQWLAVREGY
ncbi:YDG/SRA domain-containing protein [Colletotrichum graminicola]|uniref:YDG/SRA domain-containing protein n=1 Tax=Colletotrichum graminicola (strain M1.001 / M2 / FGSC 10212) TaxID=645133 RepID=E3QMM6_COLGM|nr:YDG/SRA domain-containing protein [Colletotrichum graminicola M1.001]EFQ32114.1 YDG/SRA domain-containing protein [Colletotrichum graminicola M1.001]WDK16992.1 YDG/SRA domain-containing protein [Colletotrichum graminicola]